ncbi:hypothetical protein AB3662_36155 [Sorangium cellulosum]|uniref:hypothetical protein n=1 Tax=Sorangium cellulosum TaxID=56 RepID=UPI003D9A96CC
MATACPTSSVEATNVEVVVTPKTACLYVELVHLTCESSPAVEITNGCEGPISLPEDFTCRDEEGDGCDLAPGERELAYLHVDEDGRHEVEYVVTRDGAPVEVHVSFDAKVNRGTNEMGPTSMCSLGAPRSEGKGVSVAAAATAALAVVLATRRGSRKRAGGARGRA